MEKDIKLSNIKGLLIFLVVLGHLLAPYQKYYNGLYLFIYSFHMPLFILVSGYFAKRVSFKKIVNIVMLYLIFQPLYRLFLVGIKVSQHFKLMYDMPYYHLWFLVSLTAWYLIAIVIQKTSLKEINKIFLITVFFVISFISRYYAQPVVNMMNNYDASYDTYTFSYQRTLTFLPYFFVGLFLTKEHMQKLYNSIKGRIWIPILTISAIFVYFLKTDSTNLENILKGSYGIDAMKGPLLSTTFEIIIGYIIAVIMCFMLLNLIRMKQGILSKWGSRTMPVFLFHIFITRVIKEISFFDGLNRWILLPVLLLSAVAIVSILSSDIFVNGTRYLLNPYDALKYIKKKFRTGMQPLN